MPDEIKQLARMPWQERRKEKGGPPISSLYLSRDVRSIRAEISYVIARFFCIAVARHEVPKQSLWA